jgi:diguanylate cyclase (GGDEF)-like protein
LQDRVSRALRTRPKAAAVAVCDLDHFKRLNDEHGHEAGDKALQLFSSTLRAALRPVDLVARVGGEEFVVFLPNCDGDGASIALERVRTALAGAVRASGGPIFTVSIGVAVFPSEGADLEQLVKAADRALYMSKNAGRDRITVLGRPGSASLRAAPGPIAPPVLIKIENG